MPSLYEHIARALKTKGAAERPGLTPEGLALPGVAALAGGSPFAPGAKDHLALYEGTFKPKADAKDAVAEIEAAARAAAATREPDDAAIARLERALDREDALALVDDVMDKVGALDLPDWEPLYDALSTIVLNTERLQSLKLAMALLGPFEDEETIPFYRTAARHPELSLFATTALANMDVPAATATLIALLDETTGWAKVDVVERLLRRPDVEELGLDEVLLTKAMENAEPVGSWIARGVAERCAMAESLASRGLQRDTLVGCCRLLAEMASDGTLDEYRDADEAVAGFLDRLPQGPADLEMATAAAELRAWAGRKKPTKAANPSPSQREGARGRARKREKPSRPQHLAPSDIADATDAYLSRPDVAGAIVTEIESRDAARRLLAARIAGRAAMTDALPSLLDALERHPEEDALTIAALRLAEGRTLARLRERLVARIHPERRATGAPSGDVWQYLALLEALPRLRDDESRRLADLASHDADPAVRDAALKAKKALDR